MDLKNLHIGSMIKDNVAKSEIEMSRICKFLNSGEEEILKMYQSKSLNTEVLLRWSKLLEYDFFRLYSHHLILYAPPASMKHAQRKKEESTTPVFRKSLYTKEIIEFVLDKIRKEEMTPADVINQYKIPKTTLYKWLQKYNQQNT